MLLPILVMLDVTLIALERGMGIPPINFTATGWPAVSHDVLQKLAGSVLDEKDEPNGTAYQFFGEGQSGLEACRAIDALCRASSIDTMLSNFIVPLQAMSKHGDGRVHCSLNLNTETGRLSARRPNLQNQPALEKVRRARVIES